MTWPEVEATRLVEVARTWKGTPWAHDQRCKGAGVDCTGLLAGVLAECGVPVSDRRGYTRGDEFDLMTAALAHHADLVVGDWWPGDVLVFRNTSLPPNLRMTNHCGIYTGADTHEMIHAWGSPTVNAVCEHPISPFWASCLHSVYRYRGAVWHP